MKSLLKLTSALVALCFASMATADDLTMMNGCAVHKVEGANYYNLDDPRCVYTSAKHDASKGEDARVEREAAAAKAEAEAEAAS